MPCEQHEPGCSCFWCAGPVDDTETRIDAEQDCRDHPGDDDIHAVQDRYERYIGSAA